MIENIGDTGTASPMLDKIRKLLAKAEAEGVTPAERDALNAKAAEMAARHGINLAMAASSRPGSDELVLKEYEIGGDYRREQATLMYYVLEGTGSKCVLTAMGLTAIGHQADIERGEVLATSLALQMASSVINECPSSAYTVRSGWMNGFAIAIRDRLAASETKARMEAEAQHGKDSVALVLQSREVAVKAAFAEEFPDVSHGRARRVDAGGYRAGQRATMGGTSVKRGSRGALAG
jgi:hypothetical protein